jgi:hypothetical protein
MKPEDMIRELPGPPVEEWIAMLPAGTHREGKAFLIEQGLASNHASAVLWWEKNGEAIEGGGGALVDRQYSGAKAALRPVYERVAEVIASFENVEIGPRGTYVSFGRPKQFALVRPSTKTRVDVGAAAAGRRAHGAARGRGLVRVGEHHAQGGAGGGGGRGRRARGLRRARPLARRHVCRDAGGRSPLSSASNCSSTLNIWLMSPPVISIR